MKNFYYTINETTFTIQPDMIGKLVVKIIYQGKLKEEDIIHYTCQRDNYIMQLVTIKDDIFQIKCYVQDGYNINACLNLEGFNIKHARMMFMLYTRGFTESEIYEHIKKAITENKKSTKNKNETKK